jgi:hypothetical protein
MNTSRSGGSLTFGYSEQMYLLEFMENIDDMKMYVEFLENNDSINIDMKEHDDESFEIDLDDTQSFWHNNDGDLIMCLSGIAYETRCYAYFGIKTFSKKIVLLQVCDSSTDRPYYERAEK